MLDYEVGSNDELRLHVEYTIPDVISFEATSDLFKGAKSRDKYLWNFHSHHDATYPSADSNLELVRQIVVPSSGPCLFLVVLALFGWLPAWLCVIFFTGFALGPFTQFTHFLAHARGRGLVRSRVLMKLQDWRIILTHESHQQHHIHFDRNFCILNGWGNPVVDRLRRLGTHFGFFPAAAPTVTTRAQREARKGAEQQRELTSSNAPSAGELPVQRSEPYPINDAKEEGALPPPEAGLPAAAE